MTTKLRLPRATEIMAALKAAGRPKKLPTVKAWTSGAVTVPCWAAVAISDYTGFPLHDLVRELARRWVAKHPVAE